MKFNYLLFALLFAPFFMLAQSKEAIKSSPVMSVYGGLQFQFTSFSKVNDQINEYGVPKMDNGTGGLMLGLQFNIPNTPFSTSFEGTYLETCPEDLEEGETQVLVQGHGFKLKQSATVFERNDWLIKPNLGIGFQKTSLRINGEFSSNESGQQILTPFDNKSWKRNYYSEFGVSVEKRFRMCSDVRSIYWGGNLGYRSAFNNTEEGSAEQDSFIDLSKTNLNRPTLDLYVKFDLF